MPLYVLVHKWKKEDLKTVSRKVIEAMAMPIEAKMFSSYINADQMGAWCVWEGKSAEQIKEFLTKNVPEMETEVYPVLQFYPPGLDVYTLTHALIS